MTKYAFKHPQFIKSATKKSEYPILRTSRGQPYPEVAVVGRSNVGKSSLLNHLFGKQLVKTSATPGKTQLINFFTIDDRLAFVDLPGYGYAKAPPQTRKQWALMIDEYLYHREALKLLLFLIDIRRTPGEEEKSLIEWARHHHKPFLLILTKADKISKHTRNQEAKRILDALEMDIPYIPYSSTKNIGRDDLIHQIYATLREHHGEH
jgi:GTP-binding protein